MQTNDAVEAELERAKRELKNDEQYLATKRLNIGHDLDFEQVMARRIGAVATVIRTLRWVLEKEDV